MKNMPLVILISGLLLNFKFVFLIIKINYNLETID